MTRGQELSQFFLTGVASGQHDISSVPIPAISVIAAFDTVAIAFSAAIVLTGAISIPSKAASDKNRMTAETNFRRACLPRENGGEKGITEI